MEDNSKLLTKVILISIGVIILIAAIIVMTGALE
jgi:hypothetical protein